MIVHTDDYKKHQHCVDSLWASHSVVHNVIAIVVTNGVVVVWIIMGVPYVFPTTTSQEPLTNGGNIVWIIMGVPYVFPTMLSQEPRDKLDNPFILHDSRPTG